MTLPVAYVADPIAWADAMGLPILGVVHIDAPPSATGRPSEAIANGHAVRPSRNGVVTPAAARPVAVIPRQQLPWGAGHSPGPVGPTPAGPGDLAEK